MNNIETLERINHEIIHWEGSVDKLTKHLTNEDYYQLTFETNWYDGDYMECAEQFYQDGDWGALLHSYLEDLLHESIRMGVRYGIENIFRLWYEYV